MNGRWLVIGLIASVALNLFLIGAGAGVIALGMRMARESPPTAGRPGALMWVTGALPQPQRRDMRLILRDVRDATKSDAERSRALRISAWSALEDPSPDAAAIEQKLAQSRQIDVGVRTQLEQRLVAYAVRMPASERKTFAGAMRRVLTPQAQPGARPPAANPAATNAPA